MKGEGEGVNEMARSRDGESAREAGGKRFCGLSAETVCVLAACDIQAGHQASLILNKVSGRRGVEPLRSDDELAVRPGAWLEFE